jgi:hypothetical protein
MSNLTYRWKPGSRFKGDPVPVAKALERIRVKNDGLKAEAVVREARKQTSVLHQYFDWNDSVAAEKWRIEQAGQIIRYIVVVHKGVDEEEDLCVRAFVSINDEDDEKSYTSIAHAMGDPELREQVLQKAKKELLEWRRRYEDLREFAAIFEAIDRIAS